MLSQSATVVDRANAGNFQIQTVSHQTEWQNTHLTLRNFGEAFKQNIFIRMKVCQRAQKYLNSKKVTKLLESIKIFEIE